MAQAVESLATEHGPAVDDGTATRDERGEWAPRVQGVGPLLDWPWKPLRVLRYLFGFPGFIWPFTALHAGIAVATWYFLQPGAHDLSQLATLRPGWMLTMYARNIALLLVIAGGWHLRLYWQRAQGTRFKYTSRWPTSNSKAFLFGNQVKDNMFWSIASGATVWSIYEIMLMWAYANGWLPFVTFRASPVWFIALFVLMPIWNDFHFYWIHRLIHWKPLYRAAHYLHHRNVNVGPWSGLAMHPVEHVLYFTRWLILLVVPAHPIHMLYVMQRTGFGPARSHTGFDELVVDTKRDVHVSIESFHHYLHHRYFECNYGDNVLPWDRWFGTLHDGTEESRRRMRRKRRMPTEAKGLV